MRVYKDKYLHKEKHFNDTLDIFLCHKYPKESALNFASSFPNNITKAEIRQEIKKKRTTGFARFLRNIQWIATGIKPKQVRWKDESRVRRAFVEQEDEITKSLGERKTSINVWYKLYKIFKTTEWTSTSRLPITKTQETKRVREDHGKRLGDSWVGVDRIFIFFLNYERD